MKEADMGPLKVGLAGTGAIARYHLNAYRNHPDKLKLTAVCDIRPDAMEKFAREAGVTDCYCSFEEMLEKADIDAVDICTIHDQHEAQVLAAAAAGKQVFLEKPMGISLQQCRNMVDAANKAGVTFMVGHDLRYMPHTIAIKQCIESGELGPVRMTRCVLISNMDFGSGGYPLGSWLNDPKRAGGGMVISGIIHQIDLMRYFVGDVASVNAINRSVRLPDVEEYACAMLEYENGAIGDVLVIGSATRSPVGCQYTLYGDEGTIFSTQAEDRTYQFSHGMIASRRRGNEGAAFNDFTPIEPVRGPYPGDDPFVNELLHFAECCRDHKEPLTCGRDNLNTIRVIFGIYESIRSGKRVDLASF